MKNFILLEKYMEKFLMEFLLTKPFSNLFICSLCEKAMVELFGSATAKN